MIKRKIALCLAIILLVITVFGCENVQISSNKPSITSLTITNGERIEICLGEEIQLEIKDKDQISEQITWKTSNDNVSIDSNGKIKGISVGKTTVKAVVCDIVDDILVEVVDLEKFYDNVAREDFYNNYTPASSYYDALYRTENGLMSGSIADQDQKPYIAEYQPKENGYLIRNSIAYYEDDGNTYVIIDSKGNVVTKIYRGGAYIILEEVAAYVFAFGDVPANYIEGKNKSPSTSVWGEYLRLNHTAFSGNTQRYPYEPVLPNISGCGGDLYYYEIDIGTTGTDCDPGYTPAPYNDGTRITRGAARIVYTRYDANRDQIIDINEKYLFYTYNHYNDFQEYLNYYGGWGEIFGNVTGGGIISSKTDYNPTQYIPTVLKPISTESDSNDSDIAVIMPDYILINDLYFYTTKKHACLYKHACFFI